MQNIQKFAPKQHTSTNIFAPLTSPETTPDTLARTIIQIARHAAPLTAKTGTYPNAEEEQILLSAMAAQPDNERLQHAIYMIYRYYVMSTASGFYRAMTKLPLNIKQRVRDFEEMESTIYPDFMNAVSRYEKTLGFRLMTFCRSHIYASVQSYCYATGIKRPRRSHRADHINKYFMHMLSKNHSQAEAIRLTAASLKLDLSEVEACVLRETLQANLNSPISTSTPIPGKDGNLTVGDTIPDDNSPNILDILTAQEDTASVRTAMHTALSGMSERDSHIFKNRLQGDETLENLARHYNISRERVRQIEARIMAKLTAALAEQRGNTATNRVSLAA